MINLIKCPYCDCSQEINHDNGYGHSADELHEQHCSNCEKDFKFSTIITRKYRVFCSDDDHIMEQFIADKPNFFCCKHCDHNEVRR